MSSFDESILPFPPNDEEDGSPEVVVRKKKMNQNKKQEPKVKLELKEKLSTIDELKAK